MLVAIDAAKYTHKAMICTFYGDILVRLFEFDASSTGFAKVKQFIHEEKHRHHMKEVVEGIETTGHYYENLVWACKAADYHVRILNAASTAQERQALLNWSKTDNLDLMAIVQSIMHNRGTSSELSSGNIHKLETLTCARRKLSLPEFC